MVWREPPNHLNDCYFCAVRVTGLKSKTRSSIKYPSLPSAIQPVPHTDELPVPNFNSFQLNESDLASSSEESDRCEEFIISSQSDEPQLFTQAELNDLVRELDFPKSSAEIFFRNLLARITTKRKEPVGS